MDWKQGKEAQCNQHPVLSSCSTGLAGYWMGAALGMRLAGSQLLCFVGQLPQDLRSASLRGVTIILLSLQRDLGARSKFYLTDCQVVSVGLFLPGNENSTSISPPFLYKFKPGWIESLRAGFHNLGNSDVLNLIIFCCGWCPVHCRMFNISGLYLLDASSNTPWLETIKNVSRHCQMAPAGQNHSQLKNATTWSCI